MSCITIFKKITVNKRTFDHGDNSDSFLVYQRSVQKFDDTWANNNCQTKSSKVIGEAILRSFFFRRGTWAIKITKKFSATLGPFMYENKMETWPPRALNGRNIIFSN